MSHQIPFRPYLSVFSRLLDTQLRLDVRTATVPAPETSWTPASSSTWSAFRTVAPSNKLQLAEVRSQTYVRFAESDVSLLNISDLVQIHFEAQGVVSCDDRIILVDNSGVPFADDDETRGRIYVTSMHAQYA